MLLCSLRTFPLPTTLDESPVAVFLDPVSVLVDFQLRLLLCLKQSHCTEAQCPDVGQHQQLIPEYYLAD